MKKISEYEPPKRMMIDVESLFNCDTCYHMQNGQCNTSCDAGESYRPAMSKLEIIEAEPVRHGRWVKRGNKWQCTYCKILMSIDGTPEENLLNYCPNCGSKNDGKENKDATVCKTFSSKQYG